MITSVKARTPILALILFVFTIGHSFAANKVVIIPLGADSAPATGLKFTCPAVGFFPESQANYFNEAQRATTGTSQNYTCPVHLPIGAKITKFVGVIRDNSNSGGQYGICWLRRTNYTNLLVSTLATTPSTGSASVSPQFLVDTSISNPDVIINHGYFIKCRGYANTVTIIGATVTYDE